MKPDPLLAPGMTISDARLILAGAFERAGIDEPRTDARRIVEAATGLTREALVLLPMRALSSEETARIEAFARRRLNREPVSRIEGRREFYGRSFHVTADTLDPRPDTETLVDLALELLTGGAPALLPSPPASSSGLAQRVPLTILDIGTGTGCIVLTLCAELRARGLQVIGCGLDISPRALNVAKANAAELGLADVTTWRIVEGTDWGSPAVAPDIVVSNPPYIPTAEIAGLEEEVRDYDPHLALDGGTDGLEMLRELVAWSVGRTRTWFAVEVGAGQAPGLLALVESTCGSPVARAAQLRNDLGGHTRCVAWKPQI